MSEETVVEQLAKYGSWMEGQSASSLVAAHRGPAVSSLDEIEFLDLSGLNPVLPGECASSDDSTDTRIPSVPVSSAPDSAVPVSAVRVPAVQVPDNGASANLASSVAATAASGLGIISTSEVVTGGRSARRTKILALAAGFVLLVGGGLFLRDGGRSDVGGVDSADQQGPDVEDVDAIDFEQAESGQPLDLADLSAEQQRLVLEGEIVLSGNPLIVSAPLGPEPLFDTSELGTEVVFEPLLQVTAETKPIIFGSAFGSNSDEQTLTKATLLGTIDGMPWVRMVLDGPNVEELGGAGVDANVRNVFLSSTFGSVGSGALVDRDSLKLIERPATDDLEGQIIGRYETPAGWVQTRVLPADTSVVTFADGDTQAWMRPRGGMAVFYAEFDEGERFTLTALDAEGRVTMSASEVIRMASESVWTKPQLGDQLGILRGIDLDTGAAIAIGDPITASDRANSDGAEEKVSQDRRPSLLVYGAESCGPCNAGLSELVNVLDDWDGIADVFSVPQYVPTSGRWPVSESWSYPRFHPDDGSLVRDVGLLPAVLVIDADGTVLDLVSGLDGWDDLDARLQEHLGPSGS